MPKIVEISTSFLQLTNHDISIVSFYKKSRYFCMSMYELETAVANPHINTQLDIKKRAWIRDQACLVYA